MPDSARPIVIAGAGPQGLAAAIHLSERDPALRDRLVVCDPSGDWLTTWRRQFRAMHIDRLRSPVVHHSGCDPMGLSDFCHQHGRHAELFPRYASPSTELFEDFTAELIASCELTGVVRSTALAEVHVDDELVARTDDGDEIRAHAVIVATNPSRTQRPQWASAATGAPIVHTHDLSEADLDALDADASLVVVGGGLSAAQVAVHACSRARHVTMVMRRPLRCSEFDTDPGWLGPKYLDAFESESNPARRWDQVVAARDGGSIPEWMSAELSRLVAEDRLTIAEGGEVTSVEQEERRWVASTTGGRRIETTLIVLATGTVADITIDPVLSPHATAANTLSCGLPVLTTTLSWAHPHLFLMGRLASLQLGPTAGNLSGARFGARRITDALYGPVAEPDAHRTRRARSLGRRRTPVEQP